MVKEGEEVVKRLVVKGRGVGMILRMEIYFLNVETLANLSNHTYANYKRLAIFL